VFVSKPGFSWVKRHLFNDSVEFSSFDCEQRMSWAVFPKLYPPVCREAPPAARCFPLRALFSKHFRIGILGAKVFSRPEFVTLLENLASSPAMLAGTVDSET
jgi:hypothetical protein